MKPINGELVNFGQLAQIKADNRFIEKMKILDAAGKGDVARAEQLVSAGASVAVTEDLGKTVFIRAALGDHLDVLHYLVKNGAAVDATNSGGVTALTMATIGGHLAVVRSLVEHGAAVNDRDSDGWTPLIRASSGGYLDVVRYLVEHGAAVDVCDNDGRTPVIWAARGNHWDVVLFLVEHGAAVDDTDSDGWTPLIWAARGNRWDVVLFLVEHGAAVDVRDSNGRTSLMLASSGGHLDVVLFLVEHGAAVDVCDNDGRTPVIWAARGGHLDVVCFLVEHGAAVDDTDNDGRTSLMLASSGGHLDVVLFLVEHGVTVDVKDNDGQTPLIWAARGNHWDVVRFLVEHGVAVDVRGSDGWTPLIWAARGNRWDVVPFLVEHGATVDVRDNDGRTPLMWAARGNRWDAVHFLVEHGAAVDVCDNDSRTSLLLASSGGHLDVVLFLVEHGAAVNDTDNDGQTSLMLASSGGHLDVVLFLVEHGAAVNDTDNDGRTSLILASSGGHLDVVLFLVEHGAAVDVKDNDGRTPLIWAIHGNRWDVVLFLVEHGAAVDVRDSDGWTPLIWAARGNRWDAVRFLVEHGAAVNDTDNDGRTSLMLASSGGHLDAVCFLVEHEATVDLMTTTGDTALSSATMFGRQEIVQFLLPLVRYQHRNILKEHRDELVPQHSDLPTGWLISPFEVEVEPFLDAGHIVGDYRGKWLDADVVVKLFVDGTTSATFVDEVRLWHKLRHPNVLKLYGVCNSVHQLFVCEFASNGSLPEYLKLCDDKYRTPWKFLYEAALGLEYFHERRIVHGNLRGSNILIGSDGLAKVSRFGMSSSPEGSWCKSGEWVRWASPETLKDDQVSFASDVYSLGMCVIEAVSGEIPHKWSNDKLVQHAKVKFDDDVTRRLCRQVCSSREHKELVLAMCDRNPCERLQIQAVVIRLERFAEIEAAKLAEHTIYQEREPLLNFDNFDNFYRVKTSSMWTEAQTLIAKSENNFYHQIYHDLKLIYDTLKAVCHPESILLRFRLLLEECRHALDAMSQRSVLFRLSATRARDCSIHGLHRRIKKLLQLVQTQDLDAETRKTKWKRLCREQVEIFVSEASEACVMLSSIYSEKDRSALVAVLRAELCNSDGKYTDKLLAILQNAYDDIVSISLEDVKLATTPEWFIPWFELEMNEMTQLGEGGFGSVFKAKWLDSEVVIKKLEIDPKDAGNADKKREMRQMFEREVDIWFGLSHPHVVRLFGACHVGRPFFVCELAPNGTLDEYLLKHPDALWLKLREAALGVQYLHARGIVHGDLKGNNIMIGSDGKAKVTDFGLSSVFGDGSTEMVLSDAWHWVAPECILGVKPTFASDIYSLGMCIIEALRVTNGDEYYLPWGHLPNAAVKHHVTKKHLLPRRPGNCSYEAWTLIEKMCKSTAADRMVIMTVVDELDKLAGRHGDLNGETDEMFGDNDEMRRSPLSVADKLAEMKSWIGKCDTRLEWENGVVKNIYQLLWDRLEQVATQLFPDGEDTIITKTTTSDFSTLVDHSKHRTQSALGITSVIPLIKFTELSLGGYALHRRLDKFIAAHVFPNEPSSLHDWKSACSTFMGVSASPTPALSDDDCSENEETGDDTRMASSVEMAAVSKAATKISIITGD